MAMPAQNGVAATWPGASSDRSIMGSTRNSAKDSKPSKIQPMKLAARMRQCIGCSPAYQGCRGRAA